ncbi:MAG: hypothetical protein IJP10_04210 [Clostridia bacterium]|nr:hypothetical protein [Clostridia bacterium]
MTCPRCAAECKAGAGKCAVCGCDLNAARTTAITDYKEPVIPNNQGSAPGYPASTVINLGAGEQQSSRPSAAKRIFSSFVSIIFVALLLLASYYLGVEDTFKMTGCINKVKNETPVGTWTVETWNVDEFITSKLATGTVVNQVLGSFEGTITSAIEKELVTAIEGILDTIPGVGSFINAEDIVDQLNIESLFEGLDETLIGIAGITYESTDVTGSYIASDSDVGGVKIDISDDGTIMGIPSYYAIKNSMEYEYDGHGTLILYVGSAKGSVAIVVRCSFEGNTMTWTANGETIAVFNKVK